MSRAHLDAPAGCGRSTSGPFWLDAPFFPPSGGVRPPVVRPPTVCPRCARWWPCSTTSFADIRDPTQPSTVGSSLPGGKLSGRRLMESTIAGSLLQWNRPLRARCSNWLQC
eukprot:362294-Chlamydomonas_euryale.AAC.4